MKEFNKSEINKTYIINKDNKIHKNKAKQIMTRQKFQKIIIYRIVYRQLSADIKIYVNYKIKCC